MRYYILAALLIAFSIIAYLNVFASEKRQPEYKILEADSATRLATMVNSEIRSGYKPVGGVAVDGGHFYQSMQE